MTMTRPCLVKNQGFRGPILSENPSALLWRLLVTEAVAMLLQKVYGAFPKPLHKQITSPATQVCQT